VAFAFNCIGKVWVWSCKKRNRGGQRIELDGEEKIEKAVRGREDKEKKKRERERKKEEEEEEKIKKQGKEKSLYTPQTTILLFASLKLSIISKKKEKKKIYNTL
jgi:formylmethanofuran dehydrogenase subunit E